jgi:hypothetical protein
LDSQLDDHGYGVDETLYLFVRISVSWEMFVAPVVFYFHLAKVCPIICTYLWITDGILRQSLVSAVQRSMVSALPEPLSGSTSSFLLHGLYSGAPGHGIKNLTLYSSGLPLFIAP